MSLARWCSLAGLVTSFAAAFACTGSDPALGGSGTGPDGGASDSDATTAPNGRFVLEAPATIVTAPNESAKIAIAIERVDGFSGAVKIDIQPLPDGVAASPLTLSEGVTKGELVLTATSTAPPAITKVQVVATADPGLSDTKDVPFVVRGVPGTREMSFGENDGAVIMPGFLAHRVARMPDDGLVLTDGITAARVLSDGRRDLSFGTNGVATLNGSGDSVEVHAAADGKITIIVRADGDTGATLHRLLPNGQYDPTFGNGGVATYAFPTDVVYYVGAAVDASGRVVLGVPVPPGAATKFVRFLADGKPDTAFDALGLGTTAGGWRHIAVRGDTPIAFGAGFYDAGEDLSKFALSIVNAPASPPIALSGSFYQPWVTSTTFDAKGRMLLAGYGGSKGEPTTTSTLAVVLRAGSDGSFDASFASGAVGDALDSGDGVHSFFDVALEEPSGKILCIGHQWNALNDTYRGVIVRYDELGRRDTGFGQEGIVLHDGADVRRSAGGTLQAIPTVLVVRHREPNGTRVERFWR